MGVFRLLILLLSLSLASAQVIDLRAGTMDGKDLCYITIDEALEKFGRPGLSFANSEGAMLFYGDLGLDFLWGQAGLLSLNVFLATSPRGERSGFSVQFTNPAVTDVWRAERLVEYGGRKGGKSVSMPLVNDKLIIAFFHDQRLELIDGAGFLCYHE